VDSFVINVFGNADFNIIRRRQCIRSQLLVFRDAALACIERAYKSLTSVLSESARQTIPALSPSTLKFWWTEKLTEIKKSVSNSLRQWRLAGSVRSGPLFDDYVSTKRTYKAALRKEKRKSKEGITDSLLGAMASTTNFWSLWRSKMSTPRVLPLVVNGKQHPSDIAEEFSKYFQTVCSPNSVGREKSLEQSYLDRKAGYDCRENLANFLVTVEEVDAAVRKQKKGKAPGLDTVSAEHLLNCHPILITLLTKIFNLCLMFEYVPDGFGLGIVVPLLKAGKPGDKVESYRGITLNPVISKIFEQCLLNLFSNFLKSSDRQFGFKPGYGCSKAIYTVRKTVDFFVNRGSTVNLCSIDLEKAFDKMNKSALFLKLMDRGCPLILINILCSWYEKSFAYVKWADSLSLKFKICSGTRQGGVCSPALFSLFIDDIIVKLRQSGLGCFINHMCFNSAMFADDLLMLSISVVDLQSMLNICFNELTWLDMKLNVTKSACLRVGPRFQTPAAPLVVGGSVLPWVTEIKYLGVTLVGAQNFTCDFHPAKTKFFRSLNCILGKIGNCSAIPLILKIVSTNCNPSLLYGLEACPVTKRQLNSLSYPYNSVYMKLFKTFDVNIIKQVQYYCGCMPLSYILDISKIFFYRELLYMDVSPAATLFRWFGRDDLLSLQDLYSIPEGASRGSVRGLLMSRFKEECGIA